MDSVFPAPLSPENGREREKEGEERRRGWGETSRDRERGRERGEQLMLAHCKHLQFVSHR